jgi:3-oxoacyl-[acyl-carrier-protein] synthase II
MKRVVVTGMSGVTAFGNDWLTIKKRLLARNNAVRYMQDWDQIEGLNTRLGAPVVDFILPNHYPRKKIRAMGRVSQMATVATENALSQAGLLDNPLLTSGQMGIAYGSSAGSTAPVKIFGNMLTNHTTQGITATTYVQMMSHTAAVNAAVFFGLRGRIIPTSTACTSGSMAIGYAFEAVRHGYQTAMVAGGAEELCPTMSAVFDTLFATSQFNDRPELSPRPYDTQRDGLVIGEGACSLILEEREHAIARGAPILAEIISFATNCDAAHVTQPQRETMQICLEQALANSGLAKEQIAYISAHGTATDRGDIAESHATANIFGNRVPISSLKSFFGHTLGACGALEAWLSIEMQREGWFSPTINLQNVDPLCADLDYIVGEERKVDAEYFMSNNFAFGGINTSLVFSKA